MNRGAEPATVALYKQLHDSDGTGAALAEFLEQRLDARAGRWALTDEEIATHWACRQRFGHYDPTRTDQATFIANYQQAHRRNLMMEKEAAAA